MATLNVLALQPWDKGSHLAVRESIGRHSAHNWTWLTRKGRMPRWRLRFAGLDFAREVREQGRAYDAVFATSMCSLADFRATAPRSIANLPHVLYMHENQAVYPSSAGARKTDVERDVHLVFTNLASIEAADRVLWNSAFNRDSFVEGVAEILQHAPEPSEGGWEERLRAKSEIAWPPVEVLHNPRDDRYPTDVIRVAWPHRWEHDKGCEDLLELVRSNPTQKKVPVWFFILGIRQEAVPEPMKRLLEEFGDRIVHFDGNADRATYLNALRTCDWVTSTAHHEFFGIGVCEALLCGCLPWLPDRLSYPELVPEPYRGLTPENPPADPAAVRQAIAEHLKPALAPNAVARIDAALDPIMDIM